MIGYVDPLSAIKIFSSICVVTTLSEDVLLVDCRVWCVMDIAREQPVGVEE